MILADKIIEERKKLGWSQEELADRLDVSRQSVSKWEGAQSIPDISRILQMAQLFGVTTDYLLKDDAVPETAPAAEEAAEGRGKTPVSMEEASAFLALRNKQAPVVALGVFLCVVSCVPLLLLTAASAAGGISAGAASAAGVTILLLMVAWAVFLFIRCGSGAKRYEYLEKQELDTAYGVDGMAREKRAAFEGTYTRSVAIGVVLCILSAVPLILAATLTEKKALVPAMVGILLLCVGAAVYLFVSAGMRREGCDILLQEGDYTTERKKNAPVLRRISSIYWLSATALYLAVSLPGGGWDRTWVLWPVAGVLYGVIVLITRMVLRAED